MSDESGELSHRIELLGQYRRTALESLTRLPDRDRFKRSMARVFGDQIIRSYWQRLLDCLIEKHPHEDPYELIARQAGLHADSVERWQRGETTGSFAAYLATLHVFQLDWKQLDVANRREVVIQGMLATLAALQSRLPVAATAAGSDACSGENSLSRDAWELLRRAHCSGPWHAAALITPEAPRRERLRQVSEELLTAYRAEIGRSEEPRLNCQEYIALFQRWHQSWALFFAIVPCRWRF